MQHDELGQAKLPKGLNIYPRNGYGIARPIPFFSPSINPLCYPLIHPFGDIDFSNNTHLLRHDPKEILRLPQEVIDAHEVLDISDNESDEEEDDEAIHEEEEEEEDGDREEDSEPEGHLLSIFL